MANETHRIGFWRGFVDLFDEHSSATLSRLFRSKHLLDLKYYSIIVSAVILISLGVTVGFIIENPKSGTTLFSIMHENNEAFKFLGVTFGVGGTILAWIYRSAALRLGVVDLFASEITTICRVGTVVDVAKRHIASYNQADSIGITEIVRERPKDDSNSAAAPRRFSSEENYFTAFSSNAKDLEVLNAYTVNVVTSFYTYMKVVRDYLRRAGELPHDSHIRSNAETWRDTWQGLIYMEFLGFEAARKAVSDLIEYQPSHVENTVTILITEVSLYSFLRRLYKPSDTHYKRLAIRLDSYRDQVTELRRKIIDYLDIKRKRRKSSPRHEELDRDWAKVIQMWDELAARLLEIGIEAGRLPDDAYGSAEAIAA
jgi:hypothetical protein